MTDTVRIMNSPDDGYVWVVPTHPVYATRSETGDWILSDDSAVAFDAESAIGIDGYWQEVSDPIAWDGTDESRNRILTALNGRAGWGGTNPIGDLRLVNPGTVGLIPLQGRIQIVGNSFVILPPEVTA